MDLKEQILKEHSKANCERIVNFIGADKKRFGDLVQVYLTGPYRVTQRAAWPISYCVERNPKLIIPHLKKMIDFAKRDDVHVAVKRNTVRMLQFIDIPKPMQGAVAQLCFTFLENKKETVAVQVFAMTVLANLTKEEPAIGHELRIIIEDRLPPDGSGCTAGFRARARKVLKNLGPIF